MGRGHHNLLCCSGCCNWCAVWGTWSLSFTLAVLSILGLWGPLWVQQFVDGEVKANMVIAPGSETWKQLVERQQQRRHEEQEEKEEMITR